MSLLCEKCSAIELKWRKPSSDQFGAGGYQRYFQDDAPLTLGLQNVELGTVRDINQRAQSCRLCYLISLRLDPHVHQDLDQCSANGTTFTSMKAIKGAGFSIEELAITLTPATYGGQNGPQFPWELKSADEAGPRPILHLRACAKPVPRTIDACQHTSSTHKSYDTRFSARLMKADGADTHLLRKWLETCEQEHGTRCNQFAWTEAARPISGLLLIDVDQDCVTDAPPNARYIALSYVWGSVKQVRYIKSTSATLRKPGTLSSLGIPTTIRDAILCTKSLGERYLWVDALCIDQDNPASQIAQMGLIYSKAVFVLIAAAGQDANAGLPGIRAGTRTTRQDILELPAISLITVVDGPYTSGVSQSTWETRGWTMQEKILSRKRLIFTEHQIYWQCPQAVWLEEVVLENAPPHHFLSTPGRGKNTETHMFGSAGDIDDYATSPRENRFGIWELLVRRYLERQLSYPSDTLNAFTGITSALAALYFGKPFLWGLPESHFNYALSWTIRGQSRNHAECVPQAKDGQLHKIPFPSWSWTAWAWGPTFFPLAVDTAFNVDATVTSEVEFYREDVKGRLLKVHEDNTLFASGHGQTPDQYDNQIHEQWKGHPRTIEDSWPSSLPGAEFIDSGHVQFWTSVAPFYLHRTTSEPPRPGLYDIIPTYGVVENLRVIPVVMESATQQPWIQLGDLSGQGSSLDSSYLQGAAAILNGIAIDRSEPSGGILAVDLVVIGSGPGEQRSSTLRMLIVRWKDGVAYRIGTARIGVDEWVGFKNRGWKLVRLG